MRVMQRMNVVGMEKYKGDSHAFTWMRMGQEPLKAKWKSLDFKQVLFNTELLSGSSVE